MYFEYYMYRKIFEEYARSSQAAAVWADKLFLTGLDMTLIYPYPIHLLAINRFLPKKSICP